MQFNIIFKTIFEYIHKKFRFDTFCEYRKKTTFLTCPSSVEITLERGSNRSTQSIDLKIGLDLEN